MAVPELPFSLLDSSCRGSADQRLWKISGKNTNVAPSTYGAESGSAEVADLCCGANVNERTLWGKKGVNGPTPMEELRGKRKVRLAARARRGKWMIMLRRELTDASPIELCRLACAGTFFCSRMYLSSTCPIAFLGRFGRARLLPSLLFPPAARQEPPVVARSPDRVTATDRRSPQNSGDLRSMVWHGQETHATTVCAKGAGPQVARTRLAR